MVVSLKLDPESPTEDIAAASLGEAEANAKALDEAEIPGASVSVQSSVVSFNADPESQSLAEGRSASLDEDLDEANDQDVSNDQDEANDLDEVDNLDEVNDLDEADALDDALSASASASARVVPPRKENFTKSITERVVPPRGLIGAERVVPPRGLIGAERVVPPRKMIGAELDATIESSHRRPRALERQSAKQKILTSKVFRPPSQRRKWGHDDVLPHVNWGDLFFDLFYVGGAFNLANILKDNLTADGFGDKVLSIVYFLGCFVSVFTHFWQNKLQLDSRFQLPSDVVHSAAEIFYICSLAMATQQIRPIDLMANPAKPQMFLFCLANFLGSIYYLGILSEIAFLWVDGQKASRFLARTELVHNIMASMFTLAATIYSGVAYLSNDAERDHNAIILLLVGWILRPFLMTFVQWCRENSKSSKNFEEMRVPMSIDFIIHRYGEFAMLILGEGVLSLVIVDHSGSSEYTEYYVTFFLGVLSVILMQFLFFKSQPSDASHHALRRSNAAGTFYNSIIQMYFASLIVVGVTFKMMMYDYAGKFDSKYDSSPKYDADSNPKYDADSSHGYDNDEHTRSLGSAPVGGKTLTEEDRHRWIAIYFCNSLAIAFLLLAVIDVNHIGLATMKKMFQLRNLVVLAVLRSTIPALIVALCYILLDYIKPVHAAIIGLLAVVSQISTKFLERYLIVGCHKEHEVHIFWKSMRISQSMRFPQVVSEHGPNSLHDRSSTHSSS